MLLLLFEIFIYLREKTHKLSSGVEGAEEEGQAESPTEQGAQHGLYLRTIKS